MSAEIKIHEKSKEILKKLNNENLVLVRSVFGSDKNAKSNKAAKASKLID